MTRPDASAERMPSVTKSYELPAVLVQSALLVTLLVRPETLIRPILFPAVILIAWLHRGRIDRCRRMPSP
jgi:hypothetical protein